MIGIFRSQGPTSQLYSWASNVLVPPVNLGSKQTKFNIFNINTAALKQGMFVSEADYDGFPPYWNGCLMLTANAMGLLYRSSFSGFVQETRFYTVTSSTTWGDPNATYTSVIDYNDNSVTFIDHMPVQIIRLASGALLMALASRFPEPTYEEYLFKYRDRFGVWKAHFGANLLRVDSDSAIQTTAMIQHSDGSIYFFRHQTGDTAIGMVRITEDINAGTAAVASQDSLFVKITYPPLTNVTELRASLDIATDTTPALERGGIVLAYQTQTGATASKAQIALCFIDESGNKTFKLMPTEYLPNGGLFEVGTNADQNTVWIAGKTIDGTGATTPVKVGIYENNSTWYFQTTAVTTDLYPIRDEFGSLYGGGIVSGFGWLSGGTLTFDQFTNYHGVPTTDTFPPVVTWTTPAANGTQISGTAAQVTTRTTDDVAVRLVEHYVDNNGQWISVGSFQNLGAGTLVDNTSTIDTTVLTNTVNHTLMARGYDASGKVSPFAFRTVYVNNFNFNPGTTEFLKEIARSIPGTTEADGWGVTVDSSGNSIVVGQFQGNFLFGGSGGIQRDAGVSKDIFVAKFNSAGTILWVKNYSSQVDSLAKAVCADTSGNIYVTGEFKGTINFGGSNFTSPSQATTNAFALKLDPDGNHLWSKQLESSSAGLGLAIATNGTSVFIAGRVSGTCNFGGGDVATPKPTVGFAVRLAASDGAYVWNNFAYTTVVGSYVENTGIAFDVNGYVLICGFGPSPINLGGADQSAGGGPDDCYLAKYNLADGSYVWSRVYGGASADSAAKVAVDSSGNVFVSGSFYDEVNLGNGFVLETVRPVPYDVALSLIKFNSAGVVIAARAIPLQTDNGGCFSTGIAVDAAGNVILGGNASGGFDFGNGIQTFGDGTFFVAKYTSSLGYLWHKRCSSTGFSRIYSVAADPRADVVGPPYVFHRDVYATGYAQGEVSIDGQSISTPSTSTQSVQLLKISA